MVNKINNTVVIIPCYEPSDKKFVPYAEKLSRTDIRSIVIVNDGSGEKYNKVFEKVKALPKVHYISYPENKGKGHALKTAFEYCKDAFPHDSVFVTADCDGQHRIEDVTKVALATVENPNAFVLGCRDFSKPHVPKRSRMGNENTKKLFKLLYGVKLADTQTGLRGFSYGLLDMLIGVSGTRFEYEMNQLIVLDRNKVPFKEVMIETVYEAKEDDVDKVSHFKTFSDSARVIGVLLKNLGWYFFSSAISAVVDVVAFYLLFAFAFTGQLDTLRTLYATVGARVLSSIFNFIFNYKFVFHGSSKQSIFRYYILWFFQLGASFGLARVWNLVTSIPILVSLMKAFSDILLSILSYQVQCNWVFADKTTSTRFYGSLARFGKWAFNLIWKKYDGSDIDYNEHGCVFVSRHLNMHGVYTIPRSMNFDVHIMALNVFCEKKKAFKHYSTVTFGKNGVATFGTKLKSFLPAVHVAPLLQSARAIPVYRKDVSSVKTLREAHSCLSRHECILLFPDIDYQAGVDNESEIYKGFLLLERQYYRQFGRHLEFVPLVIDDERRKICVGETIVFEDGDFHSQLDTVADKLKAAINGHSLESVSGTASDAEK